MNNLEIDMREEMNTRGYRMYKKVKRREFLKVVGKGLGVLFMTILFYALIVLVMLITN